MISFLAFTIPKVHLAGVFPSAQGNYFGSETTQPMKSQPGWTTRRSNEANCLISSGLIPSWCFTAYLRRKQEMRCAERKRRIAGLVSFFPPRAFHTGWCPVFTFLFSTLHGASSVECDGQLESIQTVLGGNRLAVVSMTRPSTKFWFFCTWSWLTGNEKI